MKEHGDQLTSISASVTAIKKSREEIDTKPGQSNFIRAYLTRLMNPTAATICINMGLRIDFSFL